MFGSMSRDSNSVWEVDAVCKEKPKDLILRASYEVVYDSTSVTMSSKHFPASVQKTEFVVNTSRHSKDCDNAALQCLKSHIESSSSLSLLFYSTVAGSRRAKRSRLVTDVELIMSSCVSFLPTAMRRITDMLNITISLSLV
jgi:hypothetical protein